jgi:uncharacterized membrane protein YfcA
MGIFENTAEILLLGLGTGVVVGLMGAGGGILVVPLLVHLLGFGQHLAQGTSLFLQLPPLGIGALREYWMNRDVDLNAGLVCAAGILVGGYGGSIFALGISARHLRALFGIFLILSALLMLRQARAAVPPAGAPRPEKEATE